MPSNSNDITLVPYAYVDGRWSLPDSTLLKVGALAQEQGVLETVFTDGSVRTGSDFLASMQSPLNIPVLAFHGMDPCGVAWLNGCGKYYAFGHFLFLRGQRGEIARKAGTGILEYWFSFKLGDRAMFDVILGLVPSVNERAVRYAEDIGLRRLCTVPRMLRGQEATLLIIER